MWFQGLNILKKKYYFPAVEGEGNEGSEGYGFSSDRFQNEAPRHGPGGSKKLAPALM